MATKGIGVQQGGSTLFIRHFGHSHVIPQEIDRFCLVQNTSPWILLFPKMLFQKLPGDISRYLQYFGGQYHLANSMLPILVESPANSWQFPPKTKERKRKQKLPAPETPIDVSKFHVPIDYPKLAFGSGRTAPCGSCHCWTHFGHFFLE